MLECKVFWPEKEPSSFSTAQANRCELMRRSSDRSERAVFVIFLEAVGKIEHKLKLKSSQLRKAFLPLFRSRHVYVVLARIWLHIQFICATEHAVRC